MTVAQTLVVCSAACHHAAPRSESLRQRIDPLEGIRLASILHCRFIDSPFRQGYRWFQIFPTYENLNPTGLNAGEPFRRLIARTRTLYRRNDLGVAAGDPKTLLPLGKLESLTIRGSTYPFTREPEEIPTLALDVICV